MTKQEEFTIHILPLPEEAEQAKLDLSALNNDTYYSYFIPAFQLLLSHEFQQNFITDVGSFISNMLCCDLEATKQAAEDLCITILEYDGAYVSKIKISDRIVNILLTWEDTLRATIDEKLIKYLIGCLEEEHMGSSSMITDHLIKYEPKLAYRYKEITNTVTKKKR